MDNLKLILLFILIVSVITACEKILPNPRPGDSLLDAPVEGLNYEQNRPFLAGDAAFNDDVFTAQKGLPFICCYELRQLS